MPCAVAEAYSDKMFAKECCLLSIILIIRSPIARSDYAPKCCARDEQLAWNLKSCVPLHGINNSKDVSGKHFVDESDFYWFPQKLFVNGLKLKVAYNTFDDVNLDVSASVAIPSEPGLKSRDFKGDVLPELADEKRYCFDATENPDRPVVMFAGISLKPVFKCCAKSERLSTSGDNCEPIAGKDKKDVDVEIIDTSEYANETKWVPEKLSGAILKVSYNLKRLDINWNVIAGEEDVYWEILQMNAGKPPYMHIEKLNPDVNVTRGFTDVYCFDEVADGPLAPRALLAAVYKLFKCCGKGEQYNKQMTSCIPRPGRKFEGHRFIDTLDLDEDPGEGYWIPDSLPQSRVAVKFNTFYEFFSVTSRPLMVFNESTWTLQNRFFPLLSLDVKYLSGDSSTLTSSLFCFEYIDGVGKIVAMNGNFSDRIVLKCCYQGEILSAEGYCEKFNGTSWKIGLSSLRDQFNPTATPEDNLISPLIIDCSEGRGRIETFSLEDPRVQLLFLPEKRRGHPRYTDVSCMDFQRTPYGVVEVAGSCRLTPTDDLYNAVRPLGAVAMVLLAAAAGAALWREDSRATAHGRALACHALCLAAANGLQATWFFTQTMGLSCQYFFCPIYFFMVAANFWLTSITMNMAHGFRQPLGAMATARSGDGVCRRFALMNAFAWGGSVVLSTVAILSYVYRNEFRSLGIIPHSFYETRTCTYESVTSTDTDSRDLYGSYITPRSDRFGSVVSALCYYFIPMLVLVVVNAVCIGLTISTIRNMRRDTAFLQKDAQKQQSPLHSVLVYCKLLLSAGIAELILEGVVWGVGRRPMKSTYWDSGVLQSIENANIYAITLSFLDVLRAMSVFWLCYGRLCGNQQLERFFKWVRGLCCRFVGYFRKNSRSDETEMISSEVVTTHM